MVWASSLWSWTVGTIFEAADRERRFNNRLKRRPRSQHDRLRDDIDDHARMGRNLRLRENLHRLSGGRFALPTQAEYQMYGDEQIRLHGRKSVESFTADDLEAKEQRPKKPTLGLSAQRRRDAAELKERESSSYRPGPLPGWK